MADHPLNLAVRFVLELCMLAALGAWGWSQGHGWARVVLVVALPLAAAALWGIFRVPNDGGAPVVTVPGPVRLALEAALFSLAAWGLAGAGRPRHAMVFAAVTLVHYAVSYDRVLRLLRDAP